MSEGQAVDPLLGAHLRPGLRIDAVLGRGSFGTVYAGYQLAVQRPVAIKVLHPHFAADLEAQRLFREEIVAIGQLDHRNVVRIFDADVTADGRTYFVMELLHGASLLELARRERLSVPRAVALVTQVLEGLASVHAAGRIHADLKPGNIMILTGPERAELEADPATPAAPEERAVLIDFGLSRLRQPGQEALGGTRAFMAPEQVRAWQLHERSDVYSAALVLLYLVTGWQRSEEDEAPPLARCDDPPLRELLALGLAEQPEDRPSAEELARRLRQLGSDAALVATFRHLVPLTERDRGRLYGREAEVTRLARALEPERPVVLTAASGTGKTSLLRAGLIPALERQGLHCLYHSCAAAAVALPEAIWPGSATLGTALERWHKLASRRLVLVLDQVEALLFAEPPAWLEELFQPSCRPAQMVLYVVLAVREDFLARVLALGERLAAGVPQVRLAPLAREDARAALIEPLHAAGLSIEERLLHALLDDLVRAGSAHGAELGWGEAVYPPHLQAAGSALVAALGAGEATLTLEHYHRLGGLEAIFGEQIDRALGALDEHDRATARELFLALLGPAHTRLRLEEDELRARCPGHDAETAVPRLLALLERQRLLVRHAHPVPSWELAHDSLVPRFERWLTVQDLERRRALEVLRFHLRESRAGAPSLLSSQELHRLKPFAAAIEELEREWQHRPHQAFTPRSLIARSRAMLRYRRGLAVTVGAVVLGLGAALTGGALASRAARQREAYQRALDLGRSELLLRPFDGITEHGELIAAAPPWPAFALHLHEPDGEEPLRAGRRTTDERARFGVLRLEQGALALSLEARGGDAVLVVEARGRAGQRCAPAMIPLRGLPGYASRDRASRRLELPVPTCQASVQGTVEIPAGPFLKDGPGEPPSALVAAPERVVELPAFRLDRTELSNAQVAPFAALAPITGVVFAPYPAALGAAAGPRYPRTDLSALDAAAYCRFLGKELPLSAQWQKALRGGLLLADGSANPWPRRNLPWGGATGAAHIGKPTAGPVPVGSTPGDVSPYGVLDLAGNVQEWTSTPEPTSDVAALAVPAPQRIRITRGGNWSDTTPELLVDYLAIENARSPRQVNYYLGARCAVTPVRDTAE